MNYFLSLYLTGSGMCYRSYIRDRSTLALADLITDDYGKLHYDMLLRLVTGKE